jgi:ankyrin repeat protein
VHTKGFAGLAAQIRAEATDFLISRSIEAAKDGHIGIVNALITAGVSLNMQDEVSKSALMHASKKGDSATVNALISAGADLDLTDEVQRSALMRATEKGDAINVSALFNAGANLNLQDDAGGKAWPLRYRQGTA